MSNETKIVPVEPTLAMDAAGETALGKHLNKAGYYGGHLAAYKAMLEAAPAPDDELALLKHIRTITDCQAEDEGLWFDAVTAPEAYLQQELRKLHSAIEAAPAPDDKDKRIAELEALLDEIAEEVKEMVELQMPIGLTLADILKQREQTDE